MQFQDPRFTILSKLRSEAPTGHTLRAIHTIEGYRRAVLAVIMALEATAAPDELWAGGVDAADLTENHRLGEHIAATRCQFGFAG